MAPSTKTTTTLLLTALLLMEATQLANSRHEAVLSQSSPYCSKYRKVMEVSYPGCKSALTVVKVCAGTCSSENLLYPQTMTINGTNTTATEIMPGAYCSCCQPLEWRIKPRRIYFKCNNETIQRRVFLPVVRECGCYNC